MERGFKMPFIQITRSQRTDTHSYRASERQLDAEDRRNEVAPVLHDDDNAQRRSVKMFSE